MKYCRQNDLFSAKNDPHSAKNGQTAGKKNWSPGDSEGSARHILIHFVIPPLPEQKKIAEILSGIDKLLRLLQVSANATQSDSAYSKVAKIKALKQAVSSDLLSGRKRVGDARVLEGVGI